MSQNLGRAEATECTGRSVGNIDGLAGKQTRQDQNAAGRPKGAARQRFLRNKRENTPGLACAAARSASTSALTSSPMAFKISSAASRTAAADPSSRPAGSGGVGETTSVPCVHAASANLRSYPEQFSGHRQGASGAKSMLHFLTVSPFGYDRLSKFLHSVRIGIEPG